MRSLGFRATTLDRAGEFVEITDVQLKAGQKDANVARYEFRTQFTKDDSVLFMIAFYPDCAKMDGVELDPSK